MLIEGALKSGLIERLAFELKNLLLRRESNNYCYSLNFTWVLLLFASSTIDSISADLKNKTNKKVKLFFLSSGQLHSHGQMAM